MPMQYNNMSMVDLRCFGNTPLLMKKKSKKALLHEYSFEEVISAGFRKADRNRTESNAILWVFNLRKLGL